MTFASSVITSHADRIETAVAQRAAIARLTIDTPELSLDDAYAIQAEVVRRRVLNGERIIGAKLGLTARAKQIQMGVAQPVFGQLLSGGVHQVGEPVPLAELIHPRVEPEIVLLIGERLTGPNVTRDDVINATESVMCGLEIIDSRYADFSFTAADVIADNTSAAKVVTSTHTENANDLDLALIGLTLEVDGELVATAAGAATMGHPADAVAVLANWLFERGQSIDAGWLIYSGGLTAAVPLTAGSTITATFASLGSVSVTAH